MVIWTRTLTKANDVMENILAIDDFIHRTKNGEEEDE